MAAPGGRMHQQCGGIAYSNGRYGTRYHASPVNYTNEGQDISLIVLNVLCFHTSSKQSKVLFVL